MARRATSLDPRAVRTREALHDSALALARQKRVEKISIAEIVAGAGVSRQAFYEHFDDRDDAVASAISDTLGPRLRDVVTALNDERSGPEALQAVLAMLTEERTLYAHVHLGPVQDRALDVAREVLSPLCARLAREILASLGDRDPDPEDLADATRFVVGGVIEMLRTWLGDGTAVPDASRPARAWAWLTRLTDGARGDVGR